jgi:hypothetical protein
MGLVRAMRPDNIVGHCLDVALSFESTKKDSDPLDERDGRG